MGKKINVEIEIKGSASGFDKPKHEVLGVCPKEKEELRKVFSGEEFGF